MSLSQPHEMEPRKLKRVFRNRRFGQPGFLLLGGGLLLALMIVALVGGASQVSVSLLDLVIADPGGGGFGWVIAIIMIPVAVLFAGFLCLGAAVAMRRHDRALLVRAENARSNEMSSARKLQLILDHMAQGLLLVDGQRQIRVMNATLAEMIGIPVNAVGRFADLDTLCARLEEIVECKDSRTRKQVRLLIDDPGRCGGTGAVALSEVARSDGTVLAIETHVLPDGGFVRMFTDITEQRRSEQQVAFLAEHDPVTGLICHASFLRCLEGLIDRPGSRVADRPRSREASGAGFALALFDIASFARLNALYGHDAGDKILRVVGQRLLRAVRGTDTVARFGADVFAVVLPGLVSPETLAARVRQIQERMEAPMSAGVPTCTIHVNAGAALAPRDGMDAASLVGRAQAELWLAKGGQDTAPPTVREPPSESAGHAKGHALFGGSMAANRDGPAARDVKVSRRGAS